MNVEVLADSESVARRAAAIIAEEAWAAVVERGYFVIAVSGGHTPWMLLRDLAGARCHGRRHTWCRWMNVWRRRATPTGI